MARTANRMGRSYREKIANIGEQLRGLRREHRRLQQAGLDMRLNDGWSAEDEERSWQEYGDGGDCWWPGPQ